MYKDIYSKRKQPAPRYGLSESHQWVHRWDVLRIPPENILGARTTTIQLLFVLSSNLLPQAMFCALMTQ